MINSISNKMKHAVKKQYKFIIWLFKYFFKRPQFELYVKNRGKLNVLNFSKVLTDRSNGYDSHLTPYRFQTIPKKIWIYWDKGETDAPYIVKKCFDSWRTKNTDWEITIIDSDSIANYVDMPDLPSSLPVRYHANLLRLNLLKKHGGVWVDATTYCHRPLTEWLPLLGASGLFMFQNPSPDRLIENWFIASAPQNIIIERWADELKQYYLQLSNTHPSYFLAFYIFQWLIKNDAEMKNEFDKASSLNAVPTFIMKSVIHNRIEFNFLKEYIEAGLPLSKLDWRVDIPQFELENILNKIEEISIIN